MTRTRPNKYRPGFNPVTLRCSNAGCAKVIGRVYAKERTVRCRHCGSETTA